jgi:hypothetical protein
MATTVGNFTAIDDSEVDAESPITESLVTRLRDNAYWVNEGTTQTSQGTGDKLLQTDGTGGVEWIDKDTIGVDGTKGNFDPASTSSITPDQVAIVSNRLLHIYSSSGTALASGFGVIDSSDDTFQGIGWDVSTNFCLSGTADGTWRDFIPANTAGGGDGDGLSIRKNGSNYEFVNADGATSFLYLWI